MPDDRMCRVVELVSAAVVKGNTKLINTLQHMIIMPDNDGYDVMIIMPDETVSHAI